MKNCPESYLLNRSRKVRGRPFINYDLWWVGKIGGGSPIFKVLVEGGPPLGRVLVEGGSYFLGVLIYVIVWVGEGLDFLTYCHGEGLCFLGIATGRVSFFRVLCHLICQPTPGHN